MICNTVKRAQAIYKLLNQARQETEADGSPRLSIKEENLTLFHARFPFAWRKPIEEDVLAKFGKPDKDKGDRRPPARRKSHRRCHAGDRTEILDLDFDVMVTDLAPIDLLLQRAGRLHRHSLRDKNRRHPRRLTIAPPDLVNGLPDFGVDELIYERYLLLQTYRQLHERDQLIIPKETAKLIEAVYTEDVSGDDPAWQAALQIAYEDLKQKRRKQRKKAEPSLIKSPDSIELLSQTFLELDEDNPVVHETFQAKTRDIAPGIALVCLFQAGTGSNSTLRDAPPFDLHKGHRHPTWRRHCGKQHHRAELDAHPAFWPRGRICACSVAQAPCAALRPPCYLRGWRPSLRPQWQIV